MKRAQGGRLQGHLGKGGAHDDAGLVGSACDNICERAQRLIDSATGFQPLGSEANGARFVDVLEGWHYRAVPRVEVLDRQFNRAGS
eukprot:scaffold52314_cov68-Attheya_sp.AAC.1